MKQKGFTIIELLTVIAILGVITAMVALNVTGFFDTSSNNTTATNETIVDNATMFQQLSSEPITSLNLTELQFAIDYCWSQKLFTATSIYQNQTIILLLTEGEATP